MTSERESERPPVNRPLGDRTVDSVASIGIYAVQPDESLERVAWLMADSRIHAVVVARHDLAEPPVIGDADLVSAVTSGHYEQLCARDIAGTEAISVRGEENLADAVRLMEEHRVSHLIVRDKNRVPRGVLSTLDVALAMCHRSRHD